MCAIGSTSFVSTSCSFSKRENVTELCGKLLSFRFAQFEPGKVSKFLNECRINNHGKKISLLCQNLDSAKLALYNYECQFSSNVNFSSFSATKEYVTKIFKILVREDKNELGMVFADFDLNCPQKLIFEVKHSSSHLRQRSFVF